MGGRGIKSPINVLQQTLSDYNHKERVHELIKEYSEYRIQKKNLKIDEDINQQQLYEACACCNFRVIPINSEFEVCPICGWIDDPFQNVNSNNPNGKNGISLIEAKRRFNNKKGED